MTNITIIFDRLDWIVYAVLFVISVGYAIGLHAWWKRYPQSFADLTWLQVVIGVGYVILGLAVILPLHDWLHVCAAFFFASLPIIFRSVFVSASNQRDAEEMNR
jgi:hypothetical protein